MKKILLVGSIIFFVSVNPIKGMDCASVGAANLGVDTLREELVQLARLADDLFSNDFLSHARKLSQAKDTVRPKIIKALTKPSAAGLTGNVEAVLAQIKNPPHFGKSVLDSLPHYAQLLRELSRPPVVPLAGASMVSVHGGDAGDVDFPVGVDVEIERAIQRPVSPSTLQALQAFSRLQISADEEDDEESAEFGDFDNLLQRLMGYGLRADVRELLTQSMQELRARIDVGTCDRTLIVEIAGNLQAALGSGVVNTPVTIEDEDGDSTTDATDPDVDLGSVFDRLNGVLLGLPRDARPSADVMRPLVAIVVELIPFLPAEAGSTFPRWGDIRVRLQSLVDLNLEKDVLDAEDFPIADSAIQALHEAALLLDVQLAIEPRVVHKPHPKLRHRQRSACQKCFAGTVVAAVVVVFSYAIQHLLTQVMSRQ